MIFLGILLIAALPLIAYRMNPRRFRAQLSDILGIEGFGIRAAVVIAAPAAAIAYTVCALWFGRTSGGPVTFVPIGIALVPFALPLIAQITGNGHRFRASFALRTFYVLCALTLVVIMTGMGKNVMALKGATGYAFAQNLGFALVAIGAIGAAMGGKISSSLKISSRRVQYIKPGPFAPKYALDPGSVPRKAETQTAIPSMVKKQTPVTNEKLPELRLGDEVLRVPKFS